MTPYYDEGGITIYHADCREVLRDSWFVDHCVVVTDPPYGINYKADASRSVLAQARDYPPIAGDDTPFDPKQFLLFEEAILWGANHYSDKLPPSSRWLVWDKRRGVTSNDFADCELAWTNIVGPARLFAHRWMGMLRDSEKGLSLHPNQKPVQLMRWCLEMTHPDFIVLDPFMGSGPTLRAAKDLGRKAIGIEIEERYCEITVDRLAQGVLEFG